MAHFPIDRLPEKVEIPEILSGRDDQSLDVLQLRATALKVRKCLRNLFRSRNSSSVVVEGSQNEVKVTNRLDGVAFRNRLAHKSEPTGADASGVE